MNVGIIEDEAPAAEKLERYLKKYDENIEVAVVLPSIHKSVEWLSQHAAELDLLFVDVQLEDGLSFEIFSQIKLQLPVIFTTAFDEFAMDAFRVNSIDYLLKPVTFTDLSNALRKLDGLKNHLAGLSALSQFAQGTSGTSYKDRFMVKLGTHIQTVKSEDVAILHAEGRTVYLTRNDHRKFIIDFKIEELEQLLSPRTFFRVNRSFIININYVADVSVYSNSRLNIHMDPASDKEIIVSREKVNTFKNWLEGN